MMLKWIILFKQSIIDVKWEIKLSAPSVSPHLQVWWRHSLLSAPRGAWRRYNPWQTLESICSPSRHSPVGRWKVEGGRWKVEGGSPLQTVGQAVAAGWLDEVYQWWDKTGSSLCIHCNCQYRNFSTWHLTPGPAYTVGGLWIFTFSRL